MTLGGVLFSKDGKTLLRFPTKANTDVEAVTVIKDGRTSRYVYQIPEECESVGKYAFALIYRDVKGFSHIELPEDLKSLEKGAFSSFDPDTKCDELVIGKKLTKIAERAVNSLWTTGFVVDPKNPEYSSKN